MMSNEIIAKFLREHPTFSKVMWEDSDLMVWFHDSDELWGINEFCSNTETRNILEKLEQDLLEAEE